jgi:hypothetical protein
MITIAHPTMFDIRPLTLSSRIRLSLASPIIIDAATADDAAEI